MRSKTPLVLMEQLVMVLIFAMAAAICMQMFALSDRLSRKNAAVAEAALLAQNKAEELKYAHGAVLQEWEADGTAYFLEEDGYRVEAEIEKIDVTGLQKIRLQVKDGEEVLFEIPVAWQEVKGDG